MDQNVSFTQRRFDLDWMRVLAIVMVFVFHTLRFFDPLDWHVKNGTTYAPLEISAAFFTLWGMPLIFVLSGASMYFALKHSALKFVSDKVRRLLVPLVVGALTFSAVQVYLERITHNEFRGSFFDFIPHYFQGLYKLGGNFAWMGMHLWYLELLFLYSLLLLPLLAWLKHGGGQALLKWLGDVLARPLLVFVLGVPIALLVIVLDPNTALGGQSFGGWSPIPFILFVVAGFVVISHEGVQARIIQYRWLSLAAGAALTIWLIVTWQSEGEVIFGTTKYTVFFLSYGLASWCWVQTALGFGFKYLCAPKPILAYVGEAVLPFYILHQTVLLVVGYFVVQWAIPDALKWGIIATASFGVIVGVYEFAVRRVNVVRFLFGMKAMTEREKAAVTTGRFRTA